MNDTITLPNPASIQDMFYADIVKSFNAFAPSVGRNPVRKFSTRADGVKRLTALTEELQAKGITQPSTPVDFPFIAKADDATPAPVAVAPKAPKAPAKAKDVPAKKPAPAKKAAPALKPVKAPKAPAPVEEKMTIAAVVKEKGLVPLAVRLRELINQKKPVLDNDAIWAIVEKEYSLDAGKKSYVQGQRIYMVKLEAKQAARAAKVK